jgi:hypothetical protein
MRKRQARHQKIASKSRRRRHAPHVLRTSSKRDQPDYGGGLRAYGHGKFNTLLDSYIYDCACDGTWGELAGDSETSGSYASVELGPHAVRLIREKAKSNGDKLNAAEEHKIRSSYGAICREGSQGFVDCSYYRTKKAFKQAWDKVEEHVAKYNTPEDY